MVIRKFSLFIRIEVGMVKEFMLIGIGIEVNIKLVVIKCCIF